MNADNEKTQTSLVATYISYFLSNVLDLFGPNRKFLRRPSYTAFLLAAMETPIMWVIGGVAGSLGILTHSLDVFRRVGCIVGA